MSAAPTRTPKPSPRRRFDHDAAFAYFAGLGATRTFPSVAERFAVSDTAIRKVAKRDNWQGKVEAIDREAARRAEQRIVKTLAEHNEDFLRLAAKVNRIVLEAEDALLDPTAAMRAAARIQHYVMAIHGQATDVFTVQETQGMIRSLAEAYEAAVAELEELARRADAAAADRLSVRLDEELRRVAAEAASRSQGAGAAPCKSVSAAA